MRSNRNRRQESAFTIVEMLVVMGILIVLIGLIFPAVMQARNQSREHASKTNLRQLGQAAAAYATAWNDRQWTVVRDDLSVYGSNLEGAVQNFHAQFGRPHPPLMAGFGEGGMAWAFFFDAPANAGHLLPINFEGALEYSGWFRYIAMRPFHDYLNGRYYDPVFWAPKDTVVTSLIEGCIQQPHEFTDCADTPSDLNFVLSSYSMSPAALYSPEVFRNPGDGGFQDPFDTQLVSALKCPSMGQVRYSDLKTQILEHHWLQNADKPCNPNYSPGSYGGCEPYYFNHSIQSVPYTLFYDGHVEGLGVAEAQLYDSLHQGQVDWGLWSRDTPWGDDGYLISDSADFMAETSFHILTTEGIRGRDTMRQ